MALALVLTAVLLVLLALSGAAASLGLTVFGVLAIEEGLLTVISMPNTQGLEICDCIGLSINYFRAEFHFQH